MSSTYEWLPKGGQKDHVHFQLVFFFTHITQTSRVIYCILDGLECKWRSYQARGSVLYGEWKTNVLKHYFKLSTENWDISSGHQQTFHFVKLAGLANEATFLFPVDTGMSFGAGARRFAYLFQKSPINVRWNRRGSPTFLRVDRRSCLYFFFCYGHNLSC